MQTSIVVEPKPTDTSCGPTCLRGVYQWLGLEVLLGDREERTVTVHDPWPHGPLEDPHRYHVHIDRLINAILLGVLTVDANLLVLSRKP